MKALEFLQEDNGGFSCTRLALLLWVVGLLGVWGYGSFQNVAVGKELLEIPTSTITLLGILVSGKVVQKYNEEKLTSLPASGVTSAPTAQGPVGGAVQPMPAAA